MDVQIIIVVVLAVLTGVTGGPNVTIPPEVDSGDTSVHPNSLPETAEETDTIGQVRKELDRTCNTCKNCP